MKNSIKNFIEQGLIENVPLTRSFKSNNKGIFKINIH